MPAKRTLRHIVTGQTLLELEPRASVMDAAKRMAERDVGAALVQDKGRLVGIFTERDILKRIVATGRDPVKTPLADVMTSSPLTIEADEGITDAMVKMREARCRHLPVMDGGRVIGMISLRDILLKVLELRDQEMKSLEDYLDYLPPDTNPGG